ncbi:hypothetical protein LZ31DRAFT_241917 [Colletotrichum somersetense]|nr:hypothetical protein LZ31DRAFT_241917 [Colletotrichum somersetense]
MVMDLALASALDGVFPLPTAWRPKSPGRGGPASHTAPRRTGQLGTVGLVLMSSLAQSLFFLLCSSPGKMPGAVVRCHEEERRVRRLCGAMVYHIGINTGKTVVNISNESYCECPAAVRRTSIPCLF